MTDTSPIITAQQQFIQAIPFRSLASKPCILAQSLQRIVAQEIKAPIDSPPYPRAIVEGYLVNTSDTLNSSEASPSPFKITGEVLPGNAICPIPSLGTAIRVATGSIVPLGDFSIVRMWEAKITEDQFTIERAFPPGFFIETQGCDITKDTTVLQAGHPITPKDIGTLASLGINSVPVSSQPVVALFSSGNEVIPHTQTFQTGKIFDVNAPMLSAGINAAGGIAEFMGIMHDDFDQFVETAQRALNHADMLVIAGGTAVAGKDFISDLIRQLGDLIIDGVPMRSGRPLIMGMANQKPIVAVAGHPPEALRGFHLFGAAAIHRLLGQNIDLPIDLPIDTPN